MSRFELYLDEHILVIVVLGLVVGLGAQLIAVPHIARSRGRRAGVWLLVGILWAASVSGISFFGWLVIEFPLHFAPVEQSEIELARNRKVQFSLTILAVQFLLLVRVLSIRRVDAPVVDPEEPSDP